MANPADILDGQSSGRSGEPIVGLAADVDSISDQMRQVRAAASSLLGKAENASNVADLAAAVEKAAGVLRVAAETDKTRTELAKLSQEISKLQHENETALRRERSERMRDYVALLTPLVTIVTLAITLVAQNWQFLRSEQNKREEALDVQWRDAVKTISASGELSPGVIALQPFLRSEKYGAQARDVAVNLLSHSSDVVFFTNLFGPALTPALDHMGRTVRLTRELNARSNVLWTKVWNGTTNRSDFGKLTKEERASWDYIEAVIPTITAEIGSALKARPLTQSIDLSGAFFKNGDWSGINFSGVNFENIYLNSMDLKNADLEGVTDFSGAALYYTAWWQAASINRPLLDYLKANSPIHPSDSYGPRSERVTQTEYDQAVQRLMSEPK